MMDLIAYVPLLPLIGFAVLGLFGKKLKNEALIGFIGSATVGGGFIIALMILFSMIGMPEASRSSVVHIFTWIQAGNFSVELAYQVDQLSILFTLIITGVGFLIHVYSIGYMHGDRSFYRFFAYLNLFIFMMLNLVLANNFLVTFLGWEGVGLASYLLIGFWYDRKFEGTKIIWTGDAAKKAFIVNRIGDFGMLVAMFLLYTAVGSLNYADINAAAVATFPMDGALITAIALLLFLGCTGKSAQIPLAVWLPDAMAGPTPVSALIHAATMVTSGIFLVARNATLFSLSPTAMTVVAIVGAATALWAATIGIVQNDIKKVLAYSTVSQLGYMFLALGVGAWTAAFFHVMTHAFFKALLFLGSGSVIHAMHEEQDIQKMGGLKKYMPITSLTFFIACFAIAGIFPLSGFFSKDEILWHTFSSGNYVLWGMGVITALCTAFYMFRLYHLTFSGKERFDHHHVHPHESPITMTFPLMVLAVLSVVAGFIGIPHVMGDLAGHIPNYLQQWLAPVFATANAQLHAHHGSATMEWILMGFSMLVALTGIFLATRKYNTAAYNAAEGQPETFSGFRRLLWNKYYVDEAYYGGVVDPLHNTSRSFLWKIFDVKIIDGIVNGSAELVRLSAENLRRVQTGIVQNYALIMVIGIVAVIGWLIVQL